MGEMRVIIALPAPSRVLARTSAEMFDDGSLGAVVEVHHPGGDQIALVSGHPDVFDRLSIVAATARDELRAARNVVRAEHDAPPAGRFVPRPGPP